MNRDSIKPFLGGIVVGGAALAIVAFSAGWVVTSGNSDQRAQTAWIDGQAGICASLVQAHRKATGDTADLTGYQAQDARMELAKTFAVAQPGQEAVDADVIRGCSDVLSKQAM